MTDPAPGLPMVRSYFRALERDDRATAASCFDTDAVYVHPPVSVEPGPRPVEARGREQILAFFHERGRRTTVHHITAVAERDGVLFIEGLAAPARDRPAHASFVSVVRMGSSGRIASYVAYVHPLQDPASGDPGPT